MKRSLQRWIEEHRIEIDKVIRQMVPEYTEPLNDEERRFWVLNDEMLYRWAESERVNMTNLTEAMSS